MQSGGVKDSWEMFENVGRYRTIYIQQKMLLVAAHGFKTITYIYCNNISMGQDGVNTLNNIGRLHHLRCLYVPYSYIHTFHGSQFAKMTIGHGINHKHGGLK